MAGFYHPGEYGLGKAEYEVGSIATGFQETDISSFDFDGVTTRKERRKLCEQENRIIIVAVGDGEKKVQKTHAQQSGAFIGKLGRLMRR